MKKDRYLGPGFLFLAACAATPPQIPAGEDPLRWQDAVEAFEAAAVLDPLPADAVLFVGSSSIRLWDTLHEDMQPLPVIQRGFGGSRLFDSVYWADRLVLAHDPRVIVMFSGTNDIAGNQPKPAARIGALFEQFVERVRERAPQAAIVYIAISPTMARQRHLDLVLETNRLISSICSSDPTLHFVDAAASLLDPQGLPDARWFRTDGLHLNARGYARWTELIKPLVTRLHAEAMSRRTTFSR